MVNLSRSKKIGLAFVLFIAVVVFVGLFSARHAQPEIEREISAFVLEHGVTGYSLSGRVLPHQIKVFSEIDYPFVVSVTFVVPRDLHASYYRTRYLVLPWGRYVLSKDASHAV
jgi:hypothetical protein